MTEQDKVKEGIREILATTLASRTIEADGFKHGVGTVVGWDEATNAIYDRFVGRIEYADKLLRKQIMDQNKQLTKLKATIQSLKDADKEHVKDLDGLLDERLSSRPRLKS